MLNNIDVIIVAVCKPFYVISFVCYTRELKFTYVDSNLFVYIQTVQICFLDFTISVVS